MDYYVMDGPWLRAILEAHYKGIGKPMPKPPKKANAPR